MQPANWQKCQTLSELIGAANNWPDMRQYSPFNVTLNVVVPKLLEALPRKAKQSEGANRASETREAAWEEISPDYRHQVENPECNTLGGPECTDDRRLHPTNFMPAIYSMTPTGPVAGSTQQTGYGALGYGIPAAIGASIADPTTRMICITGDGGAQFSLPEIMAAVDENLPVTFVIWNNHGYREIATSMQGIGVTVIGCDPSPPDFATTAKSFGVPFTSVPAEPHAVAQAFA